MLMRLIAAPQDALVPRIVQDFVARYKPNGQPRGRCIGCALTRVGTKELQHSYSALICPDVTPALLAAHAVDPAPRYVGSVDETDDLLDELLTLGVFDDDDTLDGLGQFARDDG
jgi:hypothetical protein